MRLELSKHRKIAPIMRTVGDTTTRYRFGENWARFTSRLPENALAHAEAGLKKHVGDLGGCSFLDVGSGSGLMSAAALRLGAGPVLAFDNDATAVKTSERLLETLLPDGDWEVRRGDVLTDDYSDWDIVYAWGVLHHTGDVRAALRRAASWVGRGGRFVVAIYLKTPMCGFWAREKRWYSSASRWQRAPVKFLYTVGLLLVWTIKGRLRERLNDDRGMTFLVAADDWLGGYPYEPMTLPEIREVVLPLGFEVEAEFPLADHLGWFGTGCQTIRFRRMAL